MTTDYIEKQVKQRAENPRENKVMEVIVGFSTACDGAERLTEHTECNVIEQFTEISAFTSAVIIEIQEQDLQTIINMDDVSTVERNTGIELLEGKQQKTPTQ